MRLLLAINIAIGLGKSKVGAARTIVLRGGVRKSKVNIFFISFIFLVSLKQLLMIGD
jgi:hypothetical protein